MLPLITVPISWIWGSWEKKDSCGSFAVPVPLGTGPGSAQGLPRGSEQRSARGLEDTG